MGLRPSLVVWEMGDWGPVLGAIKLVQAGEMGCRR